MRNLYVIERDPGEYLAGSGYITTWTRSIRKARIFDGRETARAECCPGNERPVPLAALLEGLR